MKVALYEGNGSLKVLLKPLRPLRENEVLIKVTACGVCGTDVHIVDGTSRSSPPVVLGHEYAGIVEETGPAVRGIAVGDRVAVDPNISCGQCPFCRKGEVHLCQHLKALGVDIDGGMAEYCVVPVSQVYQLSPDFPVEAMPFIEPVSCVVHGVDRARIREGDTVVLLGGGTIGLLMLQAVRASGASHVTVVEPVEQKRVTAKALGADVVLSANDNVRKAVLDLTGIGADIVIECAGTRETAQLAPELSRRGGVVEFFGVCPIGDEIAIQPNDVYFRELTLVGSYVNPHTFPRAIAMLHSRAIRVDAFALTMFPLSDASEALRYQRERLTTKSIILPHE